MAKIGFKPTWDSIDTKHAEEFKKVYTGKEKGLTMDEYVKWLYGGKQ